jgi:ATP-dependent exoDNAse (exonuclease V) alpha subunit
MDNDVGYSISPSIPNVVPFTEQCDVTEKYLKIFHRWQIPLVAAFATTTHKMQGSTVKGNCVTIPSLKCPWARGLDYVANSRATELSKLFLITPLKMQHFTSHEKEREIINAEYNRLSLLFRA